MGSLRQGTPVTKRVSDPSVPGGASLQQVKQLRQVLGQPVIERRRDEVHSGDLLEHLPQCGQGTLRHRMEAEDESRHEGEDVHFPLALYDAESLRFRLYGRTRESACKRFKNRGILLLSHGSDLLRFATREDHAPWLVPDRTRMEAG